MNIDKYLYEIIEDYKHANSVENKAEIFNDFCRSIWSCKNKRRVYTKTIKYKVRSDLLETEIGQIFNSWSEIDYTSYKSMTKDTDWCNLIRQKINNLYTRYFDKEVILNKDYMDLLRTPRKLYYRWINGEEIDANEITNIIESSMSKVLELKPIYQKQKMRLSWEDYKSLIENFLQRIFDNCKLVEDYEIDNLTGKQISITNKYIYDFYNEDKSYIKYICDSLEGYTLNYQKEYYKLKRGRNKQYKRCKECGNLFEIKNKKDFSSKYCDGCKRIKTLEKYQRYNQKRTTTKLKSL